MGTGNLLGLECNRKVNSAMLLRASGVSGSAGN
jgi:hypothetical protein